MPPVCGEQTQQEALPEDDVDALFQKSLDALRKRDAEGSRSAGEAFETDADVIRFGDSEQQDAVVVVMPSSKQKGKGRGREDKRVRKGMSEKQLDSAFDSLRQGGSSSSSTTRQQRRTEREKTAGARWFDMPAFPAAQKGKPSSSSSTSTDTHADGRGPSAEEMRREIQAIRLRNAIDPKRFFRRSGGGAGGDADMPKYAQLGRVISSNDAPASTLNRAQRGRTVIEELVRDADTSAYAKRKFQEHQGKACSKKAVKAKGARKRPHQQHL